MLELHSTKTVDSKTYEGVRFTIRIMTEEVRTGLILSLAPALADIRMKQAEISTLRRDAGDDDSPLATEVLSKVLNISDAISGINRRVIEKEYFRASFVNIEGVSFDGEANPGWEVVFAKAPERLYKEISAAIMKEAELDDEGKENLELPITSAAEEDGRTSDSSAASAEPQRTNSSTSETAGGTTLS